MRQIISAMFSVLRDPDQLSPDRCADSELIARIVRHNDPAALELIFWRHGPLVWSVCCRVLGASADAEDAFQATFLILSRKARTITNRATLTGWLHRVAWRTALNVQKTRSRRIEREFPLANACAIARNDDPSLPMQSTEQNEILDRELAQLPRMYCLPLILCDMESWTREAAAAELKCPLGTLNSRLARGREMLRLRLERYGVVFTGLAAVLLVPASVTAAWQQLCTSPPKSIQQLADSTIRSMALTGLWKAFVVLALCGMLVAGTTLMAMGVADGPKNQPVAKDMSKNPPATPEEKKETASRFIDPNAGPLPEGAVARIGSNRLRHAGEVTGLKYSLDGKWLASISTSYADATARLWNVATGKQQLLVKIKTTEDDRESPDRICHALGFSKDGKQFFVMDMTSFRAFDIDSGKELYANPYPVKELKVPPKGKGKRAFFAKASGAAISPDGKTYVLFQEEGRQEGILEIRDVATGNLLHTYEPSIKNYSKVPIEYSPDSLYIVVGERAVALEDPLPIIEVSTGKTISRIEGTDLIKSLRFVPGTDKLVGFGPEASVQFQPGTDRPEGKDRPIKDVAKFFDRKSGKPLRTFDVDSATNVIDVSPDGKVLAAGSNARKFSPIYDIDSGKEIARIPSSFSMHTLAFSPNGKLLAGARYYSGAISVWDMATRDFHATAAQPVVFFGVHFGPDSNTLAIPEEGNPLLDWRTGKIVERLEENGAPSPKRRRGEGVLSPHRNWFARWEPESKSISVVDAKTGKEFRNFKGHTEFVQSLSFSPDESRMATGSYDKTIRVWSMKTGEEIAQFTSPDLTGHEGISLSEDGRIMAVEVNQKLKNGSGSIILIWDVDSKKQLARIEDETVFFGGVAVSPDGKWLAAGGGNNRGDWEGKIEETAVHIWETATGRAVHTLSGHNCKYVRPGAECAFSPDSRWLATGDAAGKLRIWEVISGQEVRSFGGHHSTVIAHFSPDGKLLVAASDEAPCFIWDVLTISNQASKLTAAELQASWNDLGKSDAKLAFEAIGRLVNNPDLAVALIRKNLKPAAAIDPKAPEMPSKRLEETRALSVLEFIGNSEATKLLDELAKGAKDDALTRAAIDTRERLRKRK